MHTNNKTVVKSMQILNLFIKHSKLTFTEMLTYSEIPKTSLHRMVGSLEEMGFLTKDKDGFYSLGLLFLQFGQLVANRLDIRIIAKPIMEQLRDDVEEAVNLIIRDGNEAMYIEKVDTLQPVRLYTSVGRRSPLYAGACSRIILAYLPEEEREAYLEHVELEQIGIGTITDKEKLRKILAQSKREGYTVSISELENYTTAISAPIFNHKGEVIAGLSIAGIEGRYGEERLPILIKKVTSGANLISKKLGYNIP
ncbi:IclR family transcriptional regulator [Priestia endophytica]|jgi:IclR family transcriptional regulator, KDG regulon repressor|uniref:Transcriptional regulator, IclR family n=1 Tax=Priestia endophytica DSM 13796 TaxID=1121089 RepID=A0A1I6B518_9BACI|nr:IclR family transcriptional regulator [Priestia endophytica]KYG26784.1 IclR family transcriptional regulator [Priestia endophytica]MBG9812970.1 IclR family transcriptional regulator [Priestia endophytica]SFQ76013.1 transcriptional regulator, IclR family [Priestia endophytica DSM 13796]